MTAFLPENYEAPTKSGNYMKLEPGENKFRILSAPILGWEDWTEDKKPVRFRYDQKPAKSIDPLRPVKHFWAMIVWNYKEEKIQILQLTQASIRYALQAFSENEDWGAPYFYDIKVTKKGEKVDTEYNVAPSPHKPASDFIQKAFRDKPINLDALFDGADPFAVSDKGFTPGIFETQLEPTLSKEQQDEILKLTDGDDELQARILNGYGKTSLADIEAKHFIAMKQNLMKRKAS